MDAVEREVARLWEEEARPNGRRARRAHDAGGARERAAAARTRAEGRRGRGEGPPVAHHRRGVEGRGGARHHRGRRRSTAGSGRRRALRRRDHPRGRRRGARMAAGQRRSSRVARPARLRLVGRRSARLRRPLRPHGRQRRRRDRQLAGDGPPRSGEALEHRHAIARATTRWPTSPGSGCARSRTSSHASSTTSRGGPVFRRSSGSRSSSRPARGSRTLRARGPGCSSDGWRTRWSCPRMRRSGSGARAGRRCSSGECLARFEPKPKTRGSAGRDRAPDHAVRRLSLRNRAAGRSPGLSLVARRSGRADARAPAARALARRDDAARALLGASEARSIARGEPGRGKSHRASSCATSVVRASAALTLSGVRVGSDEYARTGATPRSRCPPAGDRAGSRRSRTA